MSKINIKGIVNDIKTRTTYLTPLVEAVCNSIDAIGDNPNGKIDIIVKRTTILPELGNNILGDVIGIDVIDNGIGFNKENRESFDTYRSDWKYEQGGKGFGRFMYIKHFDDVRIESRFIEDNVLKCRSFCFGKKNDIIEHERIEIATPEYSTTGTILHLNSVKNGNIPDKGIEVIARKLLEKLLVFFVDPAHPAPIITIQEQDGSNKIVLNEYIGEGKDIVAIDSIPIEITNKQSGEILEFNVQVYKIYYSQLVSRISLTANKREVSDTPMHTYIPEFKETLFEIDDKGKQKNYSVKAYVIGKFLDENVTLERDGFVIGKEEDELFSDISESQIEREAALIVKDLFNEEMSKRFEEKKSKVVSYVNKTAPWNRSLLEEIDLESIPMGITDFDLEMRFQKAKYEKEKEIRLTIHELIDHQEDEDYIFNQEEVKDLCEKISSASQNDLVHYVYTRKRVIDLFDSIRKRNDNGQASYEEEMHNLIFPMGKNSEQVNFEEHNLWLLDERLVFTRFTASDQSNYIDNNDAPDIVSFFDQRVMYRQGENEIISPVCIIEFKRPKRTNYGDGENPIQQALRYARKIQDGKYELPYGIEPIKANRENTPVYIYIICDIVPKIKEFADGANLTLSPDCERYFGYMSNYKAYVEIMSYRSLIEHAKMRNAIFFNKLGIS